jgi:hypothetical protein
VFSNIYFNYKILRYNKLLKINKNQLEKKHYSIIYNSLDFKKFDFFSDKKTRRKRTSSTGGANRTNISSSGKLGASSSPQKGLTNVVSIVVVEVTIVVAQSE